MQTPDALSGLDAARDAERRRLFQHMPGFVAVLTGPDHVFEYVNDAYVKLAGPREYTGHDVRTVLPEVAGQGFFELLDQVYATGEPFVARALPIKLVGEDAERFVDFVHQPLRDDAGAVSGVFVSGHDTTEGIRAERRLRALNADLERQVIERAHSGATRRSALGNPTRTTRPTTWSGSPRPWHASMDGSTPSCGTSRPRVSYPGRRRPSGALNQRRTEQGTLVTQPNGLTCVTNP